MKDPHLHSHTLTQEESASIIDRLEKRGRDQIFRRLTQKYVDEVVKLKPNAKILELGCGTGVVLRMFLCHPQYFGDVVGLDQNQYFVDAAESHALKESLPPSRFQFLLGNAKSIPQDLYGQFDVVIAHTLLSHIDDTSTVVRQLHSGLKDDGIAVIFDGDYETFGYNYEDVVEGAKINDGLKRSVFHNYMVMRQLPGLLSDYGFTFSQISNEVVYEIGSVASFFISFGTAYKHLLSQNGILSQEEVDKWWAYQLSAVETGRFFATCNYLTYIVQKGKPN
eukprot:TRINITY_DN17825_c0_g1_i1.p1 TRINITY_DN17825_c0_g1~~TRINITY_DN17825_c0_g1_i1.p1  ORF type:complete len:279 (-),score=65.27 TRINITY_DN17825_c0_g1_i1:29-865(-)